MGRSGMIWGEAGCTRSREATRWLSNDLPSFPWSSAGNSHNTPESSLGVYPSSRAVCNVKCERVGCAFLQRSTDSDLAFAVSLSQRQAQICVTSCR